MSLPCNLAFVLRQSPAGIDINLQPVNGEWQATVAGGEVTVTDTDADPAQAICRALVEFTL